MECVYKQAERGIALRLQLRLSRLRLPNLRLRRLGQRNPVQRLLRRLLTLDLSASSARVCASRASAGMPVPTA
jgi:hypothetical protein